MCSESGEEQSWRERDSRRTWWPTWGGGRGDHGRPPGGRSDGTVGWGEGEKAGLPEGASCGFSSHTRYLETLGVQKRSEKQPVSGGRGSWVGGSAGWREGSQGPPLAFPLSLKSEEASEPPGIHRG